MYYATKRNNSTTRLVGIATVVLVNVGVGVAIMNGFGSLVMHGPVESEVVIIEEVVEVEDEVEPPPPIDVELPPPPPQVILPDFVFDTPPPQVNAVTQVVSTPTPAPPPVKAAPPPQVILPDFVFDTPPPQVNAVTQVVNTPNPTPPPVKAAPPPPPAVTLKSRPKPGRRFEKPEYPAAALRAGEEGDVVVSVCVDKDGKMSDVKLVKSSGSARLDEATLKGLARTRLDPAVGTDNKPIAMCNPPYQFTLTWDLEEAKKR